MSLKIIMGNMFSGKTTELIRRLKRYKVIGKRILVLNSSLDTRSSDEVLKTHDNSKFECLKVSNLEDVDYSEVDIVAVDEAQFFSGLKPFVEKVLMDNKTILLAGLDGDYKQEKFGEIIDCIPLADKVFKITAMCMECMDGTHGPFTKRIVQNDELELVGDHDMYKAVCRKHL